MELAKHAISQTYLPLKRMRYFSFYHKIHWGYKPQGGGNYKITQLPSLSSGFADS